MVKISRAVEWLCCHNLWIQQVGEITDQQKFLSPSCCPKCAAFSCWSFLLLYSGSTITYLRGKWDFMSELLKILQPPKSCRHPEYKLPSWSAGSKLKREQKSLSFGCCIVTLVWRHHFLAALLPVLPLAVGHLHRHTVRHSNLVTLLNWWRCGGTAWGTSHSFQRALACHLWLVLHKEYLLLCSLTIILEQAWECYHNWLTRWKAFLFSF